MIKDNEWGNIELPGLSDEELFNTNWNYKAGIAERQANPDYHRKVKEGLRKAWQDSDLKLRTSAKRKEQWQDPNYREITLKAREKATQTHEYKQKLKEGHANSMTEELRAKFSASSKQAWAKEGAKEKVSNTLKTKWQDPEYKEKMLSRKPRTGKRMQTPWGTFDTRAQALAHMKELGIKNRGNTLDNGFKMDPKNFYVID